MRKAILMIMMLLLLATSVDAARRMLLYEGQKVLFTVDDSNHVLEAKQISDQSRKVMFAFDGEKSRPLSEKETYRFSDGSEVFVGHLYLNQGTRVPDMADIYFTLKIEAVNRTSVTATTTTPNKYTFVLESPDLRKKTLHWVRSYYGIY
ncbi:hypothetical protein HZB01_03315 [Candidatus Woesearchaeota archaeon]|nr:hypothetical protein [Candidatus Woesearchaeota archaeon]